MTNNELMLNDIEKYLKETLFYSKKDLLNVVGNIYDLHNKTSKKLKMKNNENKPKREPTKYQIFLKNKMQELKAIEDAKGEGEEKMKQKDIMSMAAKLWKEQKE
jgi:hypothetical protein